METLDKVRIPRSTGRVAWNREALAAVPKDGQWHVLKECGRTVGYQIARHLNLSLDFTDSDYEFGAREIGNGKSALLVRRRAAAKAA